MKTSTKNITPYNWGENCKGWKLLDNNELSIIEETMPPNTEEVMHYHQSAQQYFYILEGEAHFWINSNSEHVVKANEGISIPNNVPHQIQNRSNQTIRFLVISNPSTKGDRIEHSPTPLFNYHNKYFKSIQNTDNGEVSGETIFHYRQKGNTIWATYEGGQILFGTLSGTVNEKLVLVGNLDLMELYNVEVGEFERNCLSDWSSIGCTVVFVAVDQQVTDFSLYCISVCVIEKQ